MVESCVFLNRSNFTIFFSFFVLFQKLTDTTDRSVSGSLDSVSGVGKDRLVYNKKDIKRDILYLLYTEEFTPVLIGYTITFLLTSRS